MDNAKISIVVPVYNVEKYLDRCVESLVNQTYKDIEIILADDGSPDRSPEMCDEWAKKEPRIKVVHKKNGGLPSARNAGIAAAEGDYIGFVDSDDYVEPDTYEFLMGLINKHGAEIAVSGFYLEDADGKFNPSIKEEFEPMRLTGDEKLDMWFRYFYGAMFSVCNKLFATRLVKETMFREELNNGEDADFSYRTFYAAECVSFSREPKYRYCCNGASKTRSRKDYTDGSYRVASEIFMAEKDKAAFAPLAYEHIASNMISNYNDLCFKRLCRRSLFRRMKKDYTENFGGFMRICPGKSRRTKLFLLFFLPHIYDLLLYASHRDCFLPKEKKS